MKKKTTPVAVAQKPKPEDVKPSQGSPLQNAEALENIYDQAIIFVREVKGEEQQFSYSARHIKAFGRSWDMIKDALARLELLEGNCKPALTEAKPQ